MVAVAAVESPEERFTRNERLTTYIVSRFWRTPILRRSFDSFEDAQQIARLALLRASRSYDPTRSIRFSTFACCAIRNELLKHVGGGVIRLPAPMALNLVALSQGKALRRRVQRETLAAAIQATKSRPLSTVATDPDFFLVDHRADSEREAVEAAEEHDRRAALVGRLLAQLSERERQVIRQRFGFDGPPMTLRQVGRLLGVGIECARQIEQRALCLLLRAAREERERQRPVLTGEAS